MAIVWQSDSVKLWVCPSNKFVMICFRANISGNGTYNLLTNLRRAALNRKERYLTILVNDTNRYLSSLPRLNLEDDLLLQRLKSSPHQQLRLRLIEPGIRFWFSLSSRAQCQILNSTTSRFRQWIPLTVDALEQQQTRLWPSFLLRLPTLTLRKMHWSKKTWT